MPELEQGHYAVDGDNNPIKKFIVPIIVFIILLLAGSAFYLYTQNKKQQTESTPQTYKNDVPTGNVSTGGNKVIQKGDPLKDPIAEQSIINNLLAKKSIVVTDAEVQARIASSNPGVSISTIPQAYIFKTTHDLQKEKVISNYVDSRIAYVFGYWLPITNDRIVNELTEQQKTLLAQQRKDGPAALITISNKLRAGENPYEIAKQVMAEFPSMQPILALNGYFLHNKDDESLFKSARVFVYGDLDMNLLANKTMFEMPENTIKILTQDEGPGSGGHVIQVLKKNESTYKTYKSLMESMAKN